jgi:hypothetical protein
MRVILMADNEAPWFSPDRKPKDIPHQRRVGLNRGLALGDSRPNLRDLRR